MCHFQVQNGPFVLNKTFLVQTTIITIIYLLVLFTVQNLKNSYRGSRVKRMHHFWAQNCPFGPPIFFFLKIIDITLIYLLAPFIAQNVKKILPADPEFLGPKWPISPNENFFQKTC